MSNTSPILYWIRRDLRLADNAALCAAVETGRPIIPVFIQDASIDALGAAPKWRLGLGLKELDRSYNTVNSKIVFRSGEALSVLQDLIAETGAGGIYWSRTYDPDAIARDTKIKTELGKHNIEVRSFGGHVMFEPWGVATKTGGFFRVYTPFWNAVRDRNVDMPLAAPVRLTPPSQWPRSEELDHWRMGAGMRRGAAVVGEYLRIGETAARERLAAFCQDAIDRYVEMRDKPFIMGTSGLSENLALGEISPHQCWHAGFARLQTGSRGAETFLKELVWREFAYHLMFHSPHILTRNWREEWDQFPWNEDAEHPHVLAWKQGRTGVPFVDAAMREMYVTGRMHNRGRMIVASYLTKHLMSHWRIGQKWFEECLVDWDPAANAMGWQWAAGSGPDAAPYFRIFNPETQLTKFDPQGRYRAQWIAEGAPRPSDTALRYFEAIPKTWALQPVARYPSPIVDLKAGRERALAAYADRARPA